MSKDKLMTIRVEPTLRDEFAEAAAKEHRPAAQVLRDFMRSYVKQVAGKDARPANDGISAGERFDREDAVRQARASISLEGFQTAPEFVAQTQQFIDGEIDLDALLRMNGMEPEPGYPAR